MRYELVEWGFITNSAFQWMHESGQVDDVRARQPWPCPNNPWSIKAFDDAWLFNHSALSEAERVLDVGASISAMPATLLKHKGLEVWALDKYDFSEQQMYLENMGGVDRFKELTDGVRFVNGYLGEPHGLPNEYFDVVYSLSVLEHFPYELMSTAFTEMDAALKPGGYMIHAVDLPIPCGVGEQLTQKLSSGLSQRGGEIRKLPLGRLVSEWVVNNADLVTRHPQLTQFAQCAFHELRRATASVDEPYLLTAEGWAKFIRAKLNVSESKRKFRETSLLRATFDRDVFAEPVDQIFHRWPPLNTSKVYWPSTSVNFALRKIG